MNERAYGQRGKIKMPGYRTGADGKPLCRWCDKPVPKGRRTWCSRECVEEWRVRGDWNAIRSRIIARDKVCQICGGCRYRASGVVRAWILGHWNVEPGRSGQPENNALATRIRLDWEVDHIVAVQEWRHGRSGQPAAALRPMPPRRHCQATPRESGYSPRPTIADARSERGAEAWILRSSPPSMLKAQSCEICTTGAVSELKPTFLMRRTG